MIHKPGSSNLNADALSRSNHLPAPTQEEEDKQREDPDLWLVAGWVRTGKIPPKEEIHGKGEELLRWREITGAVKLDQRGILVLPATQPGTEVPVSKILVPLALRESAFHYIHAHKSAGHFGVRASMEVLVFLASKKKNWGHQVEVCVEIYL